MQLTALSGVEVTNEWSYTTTPLYTFMAYSETMFYLLYHIPDVIKQRKYAPYRNCVHSKDVQTVGNAKVFKTNHHFSFDVIDDTFWMKITYFCRVLSFCFFERRQTMYVYCNTEERSRIIFAVEKQ